MKVFLERLLAQPMLADLAEETPDGSATQEQPANINEANENE